MAHRAMPANASFNDAMAAADRRLNLLGLEIVTVRAAGRDFEITAVSDQDRLLAAASELEVFPFGLLLWEAGVVMADVVGEASPLGAVLELGAGAGLGGLVAAALGANVLQTDHSAEALALCRRNAEANGIAAIEQSFGDWTDWHHEGRYDCVIGADILYEPALYGDIVRVLERAVATGRQGHPDRSGAFPCGSARRGFEIAGLGGGGRGATGSGFAAVPAVRDSTRGRDPGVARLADQAVEDEAFVWFGGGAGGFALAAVCRGGFFSLRRFKGAADAAAGHARCKRAGNRQSGDGLQHCAA